MEVENHKSSHWTNFDEHLFFYALFCVYLIKLLELLLIMCLYLIIMASSHFWNLGWTKVNFIVNFILKVYCFIVIAESKTTTCGWWPLLHYIHLSVTRCKGVIKKVGIKSRNSAFGAKTYYIPCCWVKCTSWGKQVNYKTLCQICDEWHFQISDSTFYSPSDGTFYCTCKCLASAVILGVFQTEWLGKWYFKSWPP